MHVDSLLYLLLAFYFTVWFSLLYLARPDMRSALRKAAVVGAIIGPLAEVWYFADYWKPQMLFGQAIVGIEDVLVGASLMGLGIGLYNAVFARQDVKAGPRRLREFVLVFLLGLALLVIGTTVMGINSVLSSIVGFCLSAVWIVLRRRDLWAASLATAGMLMVLAAVIYSLLFHIVSPNYWDTYWLLTGTGWDVKILDIPLMEMAWYFSWGALAGPAYAFVSGRRKVPLRARTSSADHPSTPGVETN